MIIENGVAADKLSPVVLITKPNAELLKLNPSSKSKVVFAGISVVTICDLPASTAVESSRYKSMLTTAVLAFVNLIDLMLPRDPYIGLSGVIVALVAVI
tara:strand:- start:2854 stop:3150 length:297 start_codon:yes stop_codon:yes gene_type:complete